MLVVSHVARVELIVAVVGNAKARGFIGKPYAMVVCRTLAGCTVKIGDGGICRVHH